MKDTIVVNDRWGKECRGKHGGYWTPEDKYNPGRVLSHKVGVMSVMARAHTMQWEGGETMGYSFGLNRNENIDDYQTASTFLQVLGY